MAGEGQKQASRSPQPPAAARSSPTEAGRRRESARSAFTVSVLSHHSHSAAGASRCASYTTDVTAGLWARCLRKL